jgi:hypothetical protein
VPIVIVGTDAIIAASPATPVQLTHACLRAGFANVVPASWGDELIAAAVLRRLPNFGDGPVVQCSCPIVAHRLLTAGGDLRPVLLPLVAPPVAVARYVRALAYPTPVRITYVGACPGAVDDSIDIRMMPNALLAMLVERDIVIEAQPQGFDSVIPPDQRRYRSQPGGVPSTEALWTELGSRRLVELDGEDFISDVAQHLLNGKNVLIDTSIRLGCACSGAVNGLRHPRTTLIALEPPRSTVPVVDEEPPLDLDLPVPALSRAPVDVVAVPFVASKGAPFALSSEEVSEAPSPASATSEPATRKDTTEVRQTAMSALQPDASPVAVATEPPAAAPRPRSGGAAGAGYTPDFSLASGSRRTPPRPSPSSANEAFFPELTRSTPLPFEAAAHTRADARRPPSEAGWPLSRGQIIGILIAIIMIVISVSTVVTILVGRSVSAPISR